MQVETPSPSNTMIVDSAQNDVFPEKYVFELESYLSLFYRDYNIFALISEKMIGIYNTKIYYYYVICFTYHLNTELRACKFYKNLIG